MRRDDELVKRGREVQGWAHMGVLQTTIDWFPLKTLATRI